MEKRKKLLQELLLVIIVVAVMLALFVWYTVQNRHRIEARNMDYAADSARLTGYRVDEEMTYALTLINTYAEFIGKSLGTSDLSAAQLQEMKENSIFDVIIFCDKEGVDHNADGRTADATERGFYKRGMEGQSGMSIVFNSPFYDETMLNFYAPVYHDGELLGIIRGAFLAEEYLQSLLSTSYFGESAGVYLCMKDGRVIAGSDSSAQRQNVIELLTRENIIDEEAAAGVQGVFDSGSGEGAFVCDEDCRTDNVCVMFLPESGYALVQTFPKTVTQSMISDANLSGIRLEAALLLLFGLYVIWLVARAQIEKKHLERTSYKKIAAAKRRERQYQIAVNANAICTFEFNLTKDLIEEDVVRLIDGREVSMLASTGMQAPCRVSEWLEKWKQFVEEDSLEDFAETVNLEHMKECFMNGQEEVVAEYWSKEGLGDDVEKSICVRQSFLMTRDDETGDIMVMAVTKDVTEMVRKQRIQTQQLQEALLQAQHANNAKSTFLSNMSHDIRTPMNAIIGFTTIAQSRIDNRDQVRDCLDKVLSSSNHLLSLINDILDMSRIESGKVQIKMQECNLAELMHNIVNIIQPQVKAKQQKFCIDTCEVANEDVIADPLKLNQVLINLLSNAVKYTPPEGTVEFRIFQKEADEDGYGAYVFIVKDNGIGMAPEFVKHIFEPFERESTVTLSGIQGTGLGMAITKNIVDMMGGMINVESSPGVGSTFTVEIKLQLQDVAGRAERIKELNGMRAMVVDDDSNICESVAGMLEELGMRAESTTSGREAARLAGEAHEEHDPYHTYIIDWQMPDMDGVETVRMIRQAVGHDAPVIIMTAYDWTDIEVEAKEAGVTAFCAKPLFMSNLRSALLEVNDLSHREEVKPVWQTEDFGGRRVLLVEDIEMNREIAEMILTESGFVVESAPDGTDAVRMVRDSEEGYYDVVLMDIQMPIMNGYEATRAIRNLPRNDVNTMPIIAMTANALEEDREMALKCGMNAHIAKPLDMDVFMQVLRKFVGGADDAIRAI